MNEKNLLYKMKLLGFLLLISVLIINCVPPNNNSNADNNLKNANSESNNTNSAANSSNEAASNNEVSPYGDDQNLSSEEVERGRLDQEWKKFVQIDAPTEKAKTPDNEKLGDISMETVNNNKQYTPLSGDVSGPSVFRAQLLLDRSQFSPGIIDGKWGKNTEKAVYWLQKRENLPANGQVDTKTYQRLIELAGSPEKLVTEQQLSDKDVAGPFVKIPSDIYAKAKMDCMCYESLKEKLSEKFHIAPELLQQLNPKVKLDDLKAGDKIIAPNLRGQEENPAKDVERVVISDGGHYIHGLNAQGQIIVHYPSTLGSDYHPSPSGEYKIDSITEDPSWHYQPELLGEGSGKDVMIPPGPNNAVGVIWMDLSKPHYGIHGTSAPETIGYATSHGCVRMTNWDATNLGRRVKKGTPVEFRDIARPSEDNGKSS